MSQSKQVLIRAHSLGWTVDAEGLCRAPDGQPQRVYINTGYYCFDMPKTKGVSLILVHRLAALCRFGHRALFSAGVQVRHLDNDRLNNAAGNIALGTARDNREDNPDEVNRRSATASAAKLRALTDEEARSIVARAAAGETQTALSQEFGVGQCVVSHICSGRTYAEVTGIVYKPRRSNTATRKLSIVHARQVIKDHSAGASFGELATRYGITPHNIRNIVKGISYADVTADLRQPTQESNTP